MLIFVPIEDGEVPLVHEFQPPISFAFDAVRHPSRLKMTFFYTDPPFTDDPTGRATIDLETNGFHRSKQHTWPDIIVRCSDRGSRTV